MRSLPYLGVEVAQLPVKSVHSYVTAEQVRHKLTQKFTRSSNSSRALADFEVLVPYFKDLKKKQAVTSQSLQKIEDGGFPSCAKAPSRSKCIFIAAYAIAVRTSEYDLPPEMLDDIAAMVSSSYGRGSGEEQPRRKRPRLDNEGDDED